MRLLFELRDSPDPVVQHSKAQVCTERKWNAAQAVDQAINRLKHQEIVGLQQPGSLGPASKMWSKATRKERKDLVISEVVNMEEECYKIIAVGQQNQGSWTMWVAVISRAMTQADVWRMPQARLSFLIRATYDTLPSPRNLHLWYGSEEICELCNSSNPSLQHILSGCKAALTQGLTIPWKKGMEAAFKRKGGKYADLASECSQAGWRAITYPVEIWCRGYTETSIQRRPEVSGDHRIQAEKGAQRSGGRGQTRESLALTPKKGQGVGKRGILWLAAGSGREMSLPLLHHLEMFWD